MLGFRRFGPATLACIALALAVPALASTERQRPALASYLRYLVREAGSPRALKEGQNARHDLVRLLRNQQMPRHLLSALVRNPSVQPHLVRVLAALANLDGPTTEQSVPGLSMLARELAASATPAEATSVVIFLGRVAQAPEVIRIVETTDAFAARLSSGELLRMRPDQVAPLPSISSYHPRSRAKTSFAFEKDRPGMAEYLDGRAKEAPVTTRVSLEMGATARAHLASLLGNQQVRWVHLSRLVKNANLSSHLDGLLAGLSLLDGPLRAERTKGLEKLVKYIGSLSSEQEAAEVAYFLAALELGNEPVRSVVRVGNTLIGELASGGLVSSALDQPGQTAKLHSTLRLLSGYPGVADREVVVRSNVDGLRTAALVKQVVVGAKNLEVDFARPPVRVNVVARLASSVHKVRGELARLLAEKKKLRRELGEVAEVPEVTQQPPKAKKRRDHAGNGSLANNGLSPERRQAMLSQEHVRLVEKLTAMRESVDVLKNRVDAMRGPLRQRYLFSELDPQSQKKSRWVRKRRAKVPKGRAARRKRRR